MRKKHRIKHVFSKLDDLLSSSEVDAVYIASPTFLHYEHTLRAARFGKHVLCEKACSVTHDECVEMLAACERAGVVFLEAMRPPFSSFQGTAFERK